MDDIVLFQILPRLPARSIGRFMSVSKQWYEFLTTPEFTKMHLHHVNNQNHSKIVAVSGRNAFKYFRTIDCETPEVGLSAAKRPLPFEADRENMDIISSLNGLLCVGICVAICEDVDYSCYGNRKYLDIILWNPLTGDCKTLSKDNSYGNRLSTHARGCGLYYSSCDDDYKLLRVTQSSDAYIYTLKSDSWRLAKSRVDSLMKYWHSGCLLNEKLYFVAQNTKRESGAREWSSLIIRFDTKTEMFSEIATPSSCKASYQMSIVGGCIHLCMTSKTNRGRIELWKMDGDGEWTMVLHSCGTPFSFEPCRLMKNGNWQVHYCGQVFVFEVDRKKVKEPRKYKVDRTVRYLLNGKYVESIVSLKRRMNYLAKMEFQK